MAALATSWYLYASTGIAAKPLVRSLKQLREVDIKLSAEQTITAKPELDGKTQKLLKQLGH